MAEPGSTPFLRAFGPPDLGQGPPSPAGTLAPDAWLARLGALPLVHQPGEAWLYNTAADVLGVLVARASGRTFPEFLAERLFRPLGMAGTGFSVAAGDLDRLVPSYRTDPATGVLSLYDPAVGGQWARPPAFPAGGAGLVATADDYLAVGRLLLGRGAVDGRRLLSEASVAAMTSDRLTPAQKAHGGLGPAFFEGRGWGFCLAVTTEDVPGARPSGSFGWDGGMGTVFWADPTHDLVALLLTQAMRPSPSPPPIAVEFERAVYAALS